MSKPSMLVLAHGSKGKAPLQQVCNRIHPVLLI
jgi:hypothetical protein